MLNKIDKIKKKALILGLDAEELEGTGSIIIHEKDKTFSLYSDSVAPEIGCKYVIHRENEIICMRQPDGMSSNDIVDSEQAVYKVINNRLIKTDVKYSSLIELTSYAIKIFGMELRRTAKMMNFGMAYGMGQSKLSELLGNKGGQVDVITKQYKAMFGNISKQRNLFGCAK